MSARDSDEPSPLSTASSKDTILHNNAHDDIAAAAAAEAGDNNHLTPRSSSARQPPRKRRRIIISCTECHRRKQKCDRSLPCANCVSRNKQDSCRYETGAPTAKAAQETPLPVPLPEQAALGTAAASASAAAAAAGSGEPKRRGRVSKYDIDPRLAAAAAAATAGVTGIEGGNSGDVVEGTNSTNFGYSGTGASTLGFLKRIDDGGESLASMTMGPRDNTAYFGTRERYKSLVRQLPARPYIEKLVDIYFKDFNWQYNGVDQYVFDRQMDEWYSLPFHVLNTEGPQAFPPDLRAFPALVFQTIATGLLMLGPGSDPTFDALKYNASMTFEDLATDYSESGVALLALLGKRQVSHTAVIADWMRAGFLKYSGLVTESWHAIGTAIRDAQEAGLHRDSLDPKPKSDSLEDILENQWEIQRRRKTWCLLMVWDVHTGIVLGRPISIDLSVQYTLPVDAPTPKDPARTPVTQRTENEPPSLMTRTLYIYNVCMALKDIVELEKEGPCPKDFSKVDRLHEKMLEVDAQTPAYFRKQNPDTRYDDLPECFWIPLVRSQLHPLVWFNFMALHRPYIFTRPHSRKEALKASFKMLEAQRENFASMNPRHHKTFQLFFGTFDAVVLMASIFILFPRDNTEYVPDALQHFQWAVERFETMSERNRLAAAARGVLHAIHVRLKKALGVTGGSAATPYLSASPALAPAAAAAATTTTAASSNSNSTVASGTSPSLASSGGGGGGSSGTRNSSIFTTPGGESSLAAGEQYFGGGPPIDPSLSGGVGSVQQQQQQGGGGGGEWALPDGFDWGSIQPVYAMADVAYNDLMGISSGGSSNGAEAGAGGESMPGWAGGTPLLSAASGGVAGGGGGGDVRGWSFGGDFGNDSVWSVLNQYPAQYGV